MAHGKEVLIQTWVRAFQALMAEVPDSVKEEVQARCVPPLAYPRPDLEEWFTIPPNFTAHKVSGNVELSVKNRSNKQHRFHVTVSDCEVR